MVLQLFELVAGWHVSELLSPVVIQYRAGCLLVVAGPVADDNGVRGWHWHGAHADGVHMGRASVYSDRMVLGHGRHYYVLHDLAEFTW